MRLRPLVAALIATAAQIVLCVALLVPPASAHGSDGWSVDELAVIASLRLSQSGPVPGDPSNAYEGSAAARELGRALFRDARLSANGKVSCATCHVADSQFTDTLPQAQGIDIGTRRTMPIMGASGSPFLFWDGRKDSLWSQALGPLEDAREHGSNRVAVARLLASQYRQQYERAFGAMPALRALPANASPLGSAGERNAWTRIPEADRNAVNRIFANLGKAIAAYERTIAFGESRFDRYAEALVSGDRAGQHLLTTQEVRGLRAYIGKGQCVTCHNGPMLTDHAFHNTGVPPGGAVADRGRAEGIRKLLRDEFNCLGHYSDAQPTQCTELLYLTADDSTLTGTFRTPSLRNVALRPPFMDAGQFATLDEVVRHYRRAPPAAIGRSEITSRGSGTPDRIVIRLSESDVRDIAAFLQTLSGPVSGQ
jgi:cytochrome c peroxidase